MSVRKHEFMEWVIAGQAIGIRLSDTTIEYPSAADIVRIEFKNQTSAKGIEINIKPSEQIPGINIDRFMCSLHAEVRMPSDNQGKPCLRIYIRSSTDIHYIEDMPIFDQIVIDKKHWYPLIEENVLELRRALATNGISRAGIITVKQALEIIKLESEHIRISFEQKKAITQYFYNQDQRKDKQRNYPSSFNGKLYEYQKLGFSWISSIAEEGLGCILADEMGLGKTIQIITVLGHLSEVWKEPCLIVTPSTLLENWKREFEKFSPNISIFVHSGTNRTGFPSKLKEHRVILCSYDTAVRDQGLLHTISWGAVVLDEAQYIKNPKTLRTKAVKGLIRKTSIAVTGTPLENRLMDLWSIMNFAYPDLLGDRSKFETKYNNDLQSAEKLETIISPLILRRKVADVANDLPPKVIVSQTVNMTEHEMRKYEEIRQSVQQEYGSSGKLTSLLRLRQFCSHPLLLSVDTNFNCVELQSSKYARLVDLMDEIISNNEKAIVFTSFTKMSDIICFDMNNRFNIPAFKIDGRTPISTRQLVVDQFSQTIGPAILVLNPKAAGTGLNITKANHVIHYNLEWNPAVEDQATARAYRRGQTLPVLVYRLFYPNTVEEVINERLNRKRTLAEKAIVGVESPELDSSDILSALLLSPIQKLQEESNA